MAATFDGTFEYGETIATPMGIISFPNVWDAVENQFKAGKFEFSCGLMIPKAGADLSTLLAEAMKPAQRLWGDKVKKLSQFGDHCPIKDGDEKGDDHPSFGHWTIKATAGKQRRPFVVDKDNRPVGDHDEVYGGAIGLLWVKPMAYEMKVGKGVKFILEGVQKIADGKPFGAAKFDPAASGYKAPEVPAYLRDRMEAARPSFSAPRGVTETDADRAMRKAVQTVTSGFNGDVDDATPF